MGKSAVFSGVLWASVQRFGNLAITFLANMILARLLTPDDFGTIGMLMFFITIANTFIDGGFGSALIQKKKISQEDTSTVFFINIGMSVVLYFSLFFCAPAIARFYHVPLLCVLLRVEGLVLFLNALMLIQSTQLMKRLEFKKLSICNLTGSIVTAFTGILAAWFGLGVWSLVIRVLCGTFVTMVLLWTIGKWKPSLHFSRQSFRELFGFGGFMLLSSLLITISNNIQALILGRMFKPATLGNFTQARQLRNVPTDGFSAVIAQVLYPDFSNHQDNDILIKQKLERSAGVLSFVIVPIMAFCILTAPMLIRLLYGNQWDEAIPYFQILCIGGIPLCLQDINVNVIKAKGESKVLFLANLCKMIFYVLIMILSAFLWGILGFLWSMVLYTFLAYIIFAILGTHYIHTNVYGQINVVARNVATVLLPSVLIVILDQYATFKMLPMVILDAVVFFTSYILVAYIGKNSAWSYLCTQLRIKK